MFYKNKSLLTVPVFRSPEPAKDSYGELIGLVGLRRRPSSSTLFKHLLLRNHWANQSQISYGASMLWGNKNLHKWSWSHDQDGRRGHICLKPKKIFFSGTKRPMTLNLGMHHRVLEYYKICSIDDPGLTYFLARSNLVPYAFEWEKR